MYRLSSSLNIFFYFSLVSCVTMSTFSKVPIVLLSDSGAPPLLKSSSWHRLFLNSGFYGNSTKTQLELIQSCPHSPCPTAEPSMLRGERPECLPIVIKHQSNQCLTLFRPRLSANYLPISPEKGQAGTNQIIRGTFIQLRGLKLTQKVSVIGVFYPGSLVSNARSTQTVFLLRASIASPLSCSMEFAFW